jgi:hypothetical protein
MSGGTSNIQEFREAALEYCTYLESASFTDLPRFLAAFQEKLLALYGKAMRLPNLPPSDSEASDPKVRQSEIEAMTRKISEVLGDKNIYSLVFDPFYLDETDPVNGALSDDLVDIYLDLKRGLNAWQPSKANDAVWEWVFGFRNHWGKHTVSALTAIHELLYVHVGLPEEP